MRSPVDRPALLVVGVLVLGAAALGIARGMGATSPPAQAQAPAGQRDAVQASPPRSVPSAAGAAVHCPTGTEPRVDITSASFSPSLGGGTDFRPDTYLIVLTGKVINETTAPITITRLRPLVGNQVWAGATVSGPTSLEPDSSGEMTIRGSYTSRRTDQANVRVGLDWIWARAAFSECGTRGLQADD